MSYSGMSVTKTGYRTLLTTPGIGRWLLVALGAKLPVAMAPLALVFLARGHPGGYTLGAVLAGSYVVGEVVGAPLLGARLDPSRMRRQLAAGLVIGAAAFAGLAFAAAAPPPVTVTLAFLAGAGPAANAGGLRTLLVGLAGDGGAVRALSVETTLTQGIWAAAPALVAALALGVTPGAPLALAAVCAIAAAFGLRLIPSSGPPTSGSREEAEAVSLTRALAAAWPIYLTSAAAMALLATAELVLPALLQYRGLPVGWSGLLLAAFSISSVLGGLVYGMREWPGSIRVQSLVFLVVMAVFVALIAAFPELVGIAAALLVAGAFKSGVMVTRNLKAEDSNYDAGGAS